MTALRPEQVSKILQITDSFNLHRESVFIPLKAEERGSVKILPDGRLRIICPETGSFDRWLEEIRAQLQAMDLRQITKE